MLFTGVSLKKAWGFFPYESLTKWLFLYKLSFSWLELEHSVLCSFWGLTFLLISFNSCSCSQQDGLNVLAFPRTLSEFHSLENHCSGQQTCWWQSLCVCNSTSSFLPCAAFSTLPLPCGLGRMCCWHYPNGSLHFMCWNENKILKNVHSWLQRHKG